MAIPAAAAGFTMMAIHRSMSSAPGLAAPYITAMTRNIERLTVDLATNMKRAALGHRASPWAWPLLLYMWTDSTATCRCFVP